MFFRSIRNAFTLIELLIVVAIIAILAAIAVPNFLEAQVRSKVSRAKADMRSLATAIEAYAVDYNKYPLAANEDGEVPLPQFVTVTEHVEFFETRISPVITTPVAFITSIPPEPFPAAGSGENPQYHYSTRSYVVTAEGAEAGHEEWDEYIEHLTLRPYTASVYYLLSHGPDLDHDGPDHGHEHDNAGAGLGPGPKQEDDHEHGGEPALYDPTNGTKSNGDLLYLGSGIGFPD